MKSLKELQAIRDKALLNVGSRTDDNETKIVVGMATCGISAGARPVLLKFMDVVQEKGLTDVTVAQTGCVGLCSHEPIVEVYKNGEEKVTYVKVTPEIVEKIVAEHIIGGNVIKNQTVGFVGV